MVDLCIKVTSAVWPGDLGSCIVENSSRHVAQIHLPSGLEAQTTYVTLLRLEMGIFVLQIMNVFFFLTQTKLTLDNACFLACASIMVPFFKIFFLGKYKNHGTL